MVPFEIIKTWCKALVWPILTFINDLSDVNFVISNDAILEDVETFEYEELYQTVFSLLSGWPDALNL